MKQMSITRAGVVPQVYDYEWDEVGRLTKATRKDNGALAAELTYAYDASDQRVRKSAGAHHSIYVFGSLELRSTEFDGTYEVTNATEVPYLFAHGVRLGRVVLGETGSRIYLELGDHLGSTSVVMDRATGELVERSTAYAYGAAESNYRPGEWHQFREDYRFTGKEDDIEVGLIYFGARYLNPQLGRWISADPLAVHAPGEADLNLYAYVHGRVLSAVDPVGLDDGMRLGTFIVVFGTGRISPSRIAGDQGDNFKNAAHQKLLELKWSLGKDRDKYNVTARSAASRQLIEVGIAACARGLRPPSPLVDVRVDIDVDGDLDVDARIDGSHVVKGFSVARATSRSPSKSTTRSTSTSTSAASGRECQLLSWA